MEIVDPAVERRALFTFPRELDEGQLREVVDLLEDVQLDQAFVAALLVMDGIQLDRVQPVHVLHVPQPLVDEAEMIA